MKNYKNQILHLRSQGKTYDEIKAIVGCSKATISYYLDSSQKDKIINRTTLRRRKIPLIQKVDNYRMRKLRGSKIRDFTRRIGSKLMAKSIPKFDFQDVIDKFGTNPTCYLTGDKIDINNPSSYSLDHFIPASKGGDNTLENMKICSSQANELKGDLYFEELILLCKNILKHNKRSLD